MQLVSGDKKGKLRGNQRGQVTIFFATTIMVFITFIAFIINIGLFVKAKINLQNSVDAAAWAGAAVQARQMTNIAYMNWEMRNIYKEWMFKYYILGNLSINDVKNGVAGNSTNFRMEPSTAGQDSYNFPSVCIHFGGANIPNICRTFVIPGVPRMKASGLVGIDETTNAFIDTIVAEKGKNCSTRSDLNFLVTNLWAYNVPSDGTTTNAMQALTPGIAAGRFGAFPKAFEAAIRIRNLEKIVNKEPYTDGVCSSKGNAAGQCNHEISNLLISEPIASNERINKAFFSAYRNLGNGDCSGNSGDNELKCSFTLTEIPPSPIADTSPYSLSNILIPSPYSKYYLDLKLHSVNLATFYTAFTTDRDTGNNQVASVEGECAATKIGLPIPGYPMGFVKNPDVMTYYAVKGEASFVGLFNPFKNAPVKLTAFAAAKPFGGRIGPYLFRETTPNTVSARTDSGKMRTGAYVSGLDLSQLLDKTGKPIPNNRYEPGAPIPTNANGMNFWVSTTAENLGGWIGVSDSITFGIPNLAYDFANGANADYNTTDAIQVIKPGGGEPVGGLYNKSQMQLFRSNLPNTSGVINPQDIENGILNARAPTKYDMANYLIPTPEKGVNDKLEVVSFGSIVEDPNNNGAYKANIFAPLYGPDKDLLYSSSSQLYNTLKTYIKAQELAIDKYRLAMNNVAFTIFDTFNKQGQGQIAIDAAKIFSDINFNNPDTSAAKPSCASMAGKFIFYYTGDSSLITNSTQCPVSFPELMQNYWSVTSSGAGGNYTYTIDYSIKPNTPLEKLFSAYRPGALHDAENGEWKNFLNGRVERMWRNFYSTKFVHLKSLLPGGEFSNSNFTMVSEGNSSNSDVSNIAMKNFLNSLDPQSAGIDEQMIQRINH
jgi:hypothetical protein